MPRTHAAQHVYERSPGAATAPLPGGYRPRRPQATAFYRVIAEHLETMLQGARDRSTHGFGLPRHVEASFRRFLDCGILERGFARVQCPSCRYMIPELIGRLPVIAPLHELSEEALVQILTQPKNALVKQYQKLFEMDGVKLKFGKGALTKVASMAAEQKSGARGLRAILESVLLDIMYDTPGQSVNEVIINEDVIEKHGAPLISYSKDSKAADASP